MIKIFTLNDCDWWIGENLEQCIEDAVENFYGDSDCIENERELTEKELDELMFLCDDTGARRTFREQLNVEIQSGGVFPRMFASTEN